MKEFLILAVITPHTDSVSPRLNTIASRDQSKPIRDGENLVVNYTEWLIVYDPSANQIAAFSVQVEFYLY